MMTEQPPDFLGMKWREDGERFVAVMDAVAFFPLYNVERDDLRAAGVTCSKDDGIWHVYYTPKFDRTGAEILLPQLEVAYAIKLQEARNLVIQKQREAEIAAENARRDREEWLEANSDLVETTIAKAKSLQSAYGDALYGKDLIAKMLGHRPSSLLISDMRKAIRQAETRIASTAAKPVPARPKTTVSWPDDVVVKTVEILTHLDDDHATQRDGKGWDAFHTSIGHWCSGALKDDRYREKALMLARSILGGYVDQLSGYLPETDLSKS